MAPTGSRNACRGNLANRARDRGKRRRKAGCEGVFDLEPESGGGVHIFALYSLIGLLDSAPLSNDYLVFGSVRPFWKAAYVAAAPENPRKSFWMNGLTSTSASGLGFHRNGRRRGKSRNE
jgi:hypothetical protein